jgi:hypothetical protein
MMCGPSNHCVAMVSSGDVCDDTHWCGYGTICYVATGQTSGTCGALPATEGAPCVPQPAGPGCDTESAKLVCDAATNKCVPMPLTTLARPCNASTLCVNGYCMATCVAWPLEGQDCANGVPCTAGLGCITTADGHKTCQHRTAAACR